MPLHRGPSFSSPKETEIISGTQKLALIEEIARLSAPQAQIRLIDAIQKFGEDNSIQFILTSPISPNLLASKG